MYHFLQKLFFPALLASVLFQVGCEHFPKNSNDAASKPEPAIKTDLYVMLPSHSSAENFDVATVQSCELKEGLMSSLSTQSKEKGVVVARADASTTAQRPRLNLHIEHLEAAKSRIRFGSRQISTELTVSASLLTASKERTKVATCSTGLGVNPQANTKACTRLQQCSDQISEELLVWLQQQGI